MKKILVGISVMLVYLLKPLKVYAYTSGMGFAGRLIIQVTSFIDFYITLILGKNDILTLHQKVYGGNFILNKSVAKVDYASIEREIQIPSLRKNILLGAALSSLGDGFVMNAPIIALGEPIRTQAREYLDAHHFLPQVITLTHSDIRQKAGTILQEWVDGENPANMRIMRSTITRLVIFLVEGIGISKKDAEAVTLAYLKRSGQTHLFKQYFPLIAGLIGTDRRLTKEVHVPLRQLGVPNAAIDYTLFAGMLGIGNLFDQCIRDIRAQQIDYGQLAPEQRTNLVMEAARRQPVVAGTHRIVESPESIVIAGKKVTLSAGDIILYPLVCANTDETEFKCPHQFDLNRSVEEHSKILSWSKGPHACPAKGLSIEITLAMLESLQGKIPLSTIKY